MTKTATQITIPKEGVVTHKTTKTANGFSYTVELVRYQTPPLLLKKVDGFRSRAVATHRAKARKMYFKSCQQQNLLATI